MEQDDAIIGTLYSRRDALLLAGQAGLGLAVGGPMSKMLGGFGQQTKPRINIVASPQLEEGPFFVEEKLNRFDLTQGSTRPSVLRAVPLEIEITLLKLSKDSAAPLANAQIDLWCCDAIGVYSDVNHPMNHENTAGNPFLRGYQITNAEGHVKLKTIIPGWYPGRAPHIHLKVRTFSEAHKLTADFTSQFFFSDSIVKSIYSAGPYKDRPTPDTPNPRDHVFNQRESDGTRAGSLMTLDAKKILGQDAFRANFTIGLTDQNFTAQRRGRGGDEMLVEWENF